MQANQLTLMNPQSSSNTDNGLSASSSCYVMGHSPNGGFHYQYNAAAPTTSTPSSSTGMTMEQHYQQQQQQSNAGYYTSLPSGNMHYANHHQFYDYGTAASGAAAYQAAFQSSQSQHQQQQQQNDNFNFQIAMAASAAAAAKTSAASSSSSMASSSFTSSSISPMSSKSSSSSSSNSPLLISNPSFADQFDVAAAANEVKASVMNSNAAMMTSPSMGAYYSTSASSANVSNELTVFPPLTNIYQQIANKSSNHSNLFGVPNGVHRHQILNIKCDPAEAFSSGSLAADSDRQYSKLLTDSSSSSSSSPSVSQPFFSTPGSVASGLLFKSSLTNGSSGLLPTINRNSLSTSSTSLSSSNEPNNPQSLDMKSAGMCYYNERKLHHFKDGLSSNTILQPSPSTAAASLYQQYHQSNVQSSSTNTSNCFLSQYSSQFGLGIAPNELQYHEPQSGQAMSALHYMKSAGYTDLYSSVNQVEPSPFLYAHNEEFARSTRQLMSHEAQGGQVVKHEPQPGRNVKNASSAPFGKVKSKRSSRKFKDLFEPAIDLSQPNVTTIMQRPVDMGEVI